MYGEWKVNGVQGKFNKPKHKNYKSKKIVYDDVREKREGKYYQFKFLYDPKKYKN